MTLTHLFHNQGKGRPVGGGGEIIDWLLRDDFTDTLTAGNVNGTAATPGPGTRVVTDTGSLLSLASGEAVFGTGGGWGDPGVWYDAITRTAGQTIVFALRTTATTNLFVNAGLDTNQAGQNTSGIVYGLSGAVAASAKDNGVDYTASRITLSATTYYYAIVCRAAGQYYFIKGGAFSDWTLFWIGSVDSTATEYPGITSASTNAVYADFLRVPDETWLPTPLCYDTFTDDNSTSLDAHSSDSTGPDSQAGVTARSWTEQSGAWDIQSNRANPDGAALATVDTSQADIVVDLVVNGGAAGQPGILLRFADTSNYWYLQADRANNQLELHEVNATVDTVRANAAVTINDSTDYTLRAICDGTTIDGFLDGGNKISYGSASLNQTETEHGLYSDNTACEFDDLAIFARDSGYSKLDSYTS